MKTGLELIAELEVDIKRREAVQDDRTQRITNREKKNFNKLNYKKNGIY